VRNGSSNYKHVCNICTWYKLVCWIKQNKRTHEGGSEYIRQATQCVPFHSIYVKQEIQNKNKNKDWTNKMEEQKRVCSVCTILEYYVVEGERERDPNPTVLICHCQ
jgi:hypothetical protein